ncbi:DUF5134 domain-containing protein [Streptomyces sp. NPDC091292]|uniref:DUF5134 domain-containing protein n=1 Tax=Streptomyces sp. NPDC091292 TaxID=3365991 RepID=UPI0038224ED9
MHAPASAAWLLVALCAASGAYCLLRMRSAVEEQRRAAGAEALMGFGMAAMAVPAAFVTPPRAMWLVCAVVFAAAGLRSVAGVGPRGARGPRGDAHQLHHLVGAVAMVYMSVVMAASPGGHAGHGTSGTPLLTGALLLYFAAYVLRSGTRLIPATATRLGHGQGQGYGHEYGGGTGTAALGWGDRPELARACRLSMGIAMFAMLLTL